MELSFELMGSRALLIVEGDGIEEKFFSSIKEKFSILMEIVPYHGNISMLYDDMFKHDFNANIVDLLKSRESDPAKLEILNHSYTDIFVVLDFDPQHSIRQYDGESIDTALRRNVQRISRKAFEMSKRMSNSTDPCAGKLYINYPSMESFRDMDSFEDRGYVERFLAIINLVKKFGGQGYKALVGQRSVEKNPAKYSLEDCQMIMAGNVSKLSRIVDGVCRKMSYDEYMEKSAQDTILLKQCKFVNQYLVLGVINTSMFMVIDYKGRGFYDALPFCYFVTDAGSASLCRG